MIEIRDDIQSRYKDDIQNRLTKINTLASERRYLVQDGCSPRIEFYELMPDLEL